MAFGYIFGGSDCNVHQLRLSSNPDILHVDDSPDQYNIWSDGVGTPVVGTWRSKEFNMGSWHMVKQIRQVLLDIYGENVEAIVYLKDVDGKTYENTLLPATTIPNVDDDVPDIDTDPRLGKTVKIRISGEKLDIREVTIVWRKMRLRSAQIG